VARQFICWHSDQTLASVVHSIATRLIEPIDNSGNDVLEGLIVESHAILFVPPVSVSRGIG
jgi:hypothetical protein